MRRRGTVSRKPAKSQHGGTTKPKRNNAPTAARRPISPIANLQEQLKRQDRELEEAREERAAIAEVLRVISSSSGELKPVFEAMLANAVRLCEAKFGDLYLYEGGRLRMVAGHNVPPEYADHADAVRSIRRPVVPLLRRSEPSGRHSSPTSRQADLMRSAIGRPLTLSSLVAFGLPSLCRCSKTTR